MIRRFRFLLAVALLAAPAAADPFASLADELAEAAARCGARGIAVLGFSGEPGAAAPELAEERLLAALVERSAVPVVERRLLDKLLRERFLAELLSPGSPAATPAEVDAVVAGSVALDGRGAELRARLIDARSGRILHAAARRIRLPAAARAGAGGDEWLCRDACTTEELAERSRLESMLRAARRGVWKFPAPAASP